jgi:glycogen(starch) synthase
MIRHILMTARIDSTEWIYSMELARALSSHGGRVSLCISGGLLTKEQRREAARVPGLAVFDTGEDLTWSGGFPKDLTKATNILRKLEENLRPDVVHLNGFTYGPVVFNMPVVLAAHSTAETMPGIVDTSDRLRYRAEMSASLEFADLVVAPTFALLEDLKRSFPFNTPCRVIPYFRQVTESKATAKRRYIYSAGQASENKSLLATVETVAEEMNWPIVSAPDPVFGSIFSTGQTSETKTVPAKPSDQISKAAIYFLPAGSEPSDACVLEGALSRCALVIGDVPNLRENWNHCAMFVPPGDTESLKNNLRLLISDQDLREELGVRAYERAKEFSPERCIDAWLDVYQSAHASKLKHTAK